MSPDYVKAIEGGVHPTQIIETKIFARRWLILTIFVLYSASNAMQWIQYSIIANIVERYYNVSSFLVDMTSMIYMITYIPFIFPASYLLDRFGLRFAVIVGAIGTTIGAWIKVFSVSPDLFWITFIGHTFVAVSQTFVLSVPARLAAVWFGPDQVSSACSIGVFGNQQAETLVYSRVVNNLYDVTGILDEDNIMLNHEDRPPIMIVIQRPEPIKGYEKSDESRDLTSLYKKHRRNPYSTTFNVSCLLLRSFLCSQLGIAIGFLFPPILVPNSDDLAVVARGFQIMFYIVAAFTSLILVVILLFFKAQPPLPPSPAQAVQRENDSAEDFIQSIKRLFTNVGYLLLLLSYAINVGIFYAISTLLNQIILEYFPRHEEDAGRIGLTIICAGMLGSVVCGIILDKTHKYKFFMTGYLPVGFELAAELTYPEPEGTAAGLLNAVTQVFGIIFTILYGNLIKLLSNLWANIVLCIALAIGAFLTTIIPNDLRRQNAKF
uniref:Major facilitator superfamily (MFS) profile domain-containing protein n=1 Tax=Vespula pensylvanica TaxID=30213 RepID=A0A834NYE1_VESPE|nr:hypothetical protein H0235_009240 [Vespula pensylvanica]